MVFVFVFLVTGKIFGLNIGKGSRGRPRDEDVMAIEDPEKFFETESGCFYAILLHLKGLTGELK